MNRPGRNHCDDWRPSAPERVRTRRRFRRWAGLLLLTVASSVGAQEWIYTMRPGDNLWNLTETYLKGIRYWRPLQRLNGIEDPLAVRPGFRLRVPVAWIKVQPAAVRLAQAHGDVRGAAKSAASSEPLAVGVTLAMGAYVVTGPDSSAVLEFADGSRLLLQADSEIHLDHLSAYGDTGMVDTRLRLPAGRVDTQVQPSRGPGSRYEITTPAAVAAVRGTDFRVGVERATAITRSEVVGGKVGVRAERVSQLVPAGFGTVAEAGKPPSVPKPLLPPPDTRAVAALYRRLPLMVAWPALNEAVAYRGQIYPRGRLDTLLVDTRAEGPRLRGIDLPDGDYLLRLRGIDALGLEGLNADHPFTLDARPVPPVLQDLVDGTVIREPRPTFRWSAGETSAAFHLQLARDAAFAERVQDLPRQAGTDWRPDSALPPARYYWRVASLTEAGEEGPFTDVQTFEIKAVPAGPGLEPPSIDRSVLRLRWTAVPETVAYDAQLARDPAFEDLLVDTRVDTPQLAVPRPESRRYYFRARAIAADGYVGPFGEAQRIHVPPYSYWPLLIPVLPFLL